MRIDSRAFGYSAGITAAVLFTVCAAFVELAPRATTAFLGLVVHMDLSGVARPLTLSGFIGGLLFWTIGTGLTFGFAASLYDRLVGPAAAPASGSVRRAGAVSG
jgi:hypothetical protein